MIHADQHRWDCIGANGNADIRTPWIDRLAAEGVNYTNHYCAYPMCAPSRYSLLTGMYSSDHLGMSNYCSIPQGLATFASELRSSGYRTATVGKMHFTPTYLDVGFDHMSLAEQDGPGRFEDDYHRYLSELGLLDEIDLVDQRWEYRRNAGSDYWQSFGAEKSDLPYEHHSTTYITAQALSQIDNFSQSGGNLLMIGYIKPHHPFDPPEPFASMYDGDKLMIPSGYTAEVPPLDYKRGKGYFDNAGLDEKKLRNVLKHYYGTISHIDEGVGKIIEKLKETEIYDDTMIIYTSDHGEYLGFHHMLLKGNYIYEPLCRIPLIIKYPKRMNMRGENAALSSNIDVARTILSVCGAPHPKSMYALDLTSDFTGREHVICEQFGAHQSYAIRDRRYKLIISEFEPHYRLFDLQNDPLEMNDLADNVEYTNIIQSLKDKLLNDRLFHRQGFALVSQEARVIKGAANETQRKPLRKEAAEKMREKSGTKAVELVY